MMSANGKTSTATAGTRGLVVFLVWPALPYGPRMVVSLSLVVAGVVAQMVTGSFLIGVLPVLAGNLLLLVRGYDNRVDIKSFSPEAGWQNASREKLDAVLKMDKSIRSWDRSLIDITNVLGAVVFVVVLSGLALPAVFLTGFARALALDAMILLLPHWFTGVRRVLRLPQVVVRAEALIQVLDGAAEMIKDDRVDIMMLLKGKEVQVPDDIKFRLNFPEQDEAFLGLYGQVVINDVQGRSYPYFYVVMVARKSYGLEAISKRFATPDAMTLKFDTDAEVEFIVLRQATTKTSGYHTKPADALNIFVAGYELARQAALRETASSA